MPTVQEGTKEGQTPLLSSPLQQGDRERRHRDQIRVEDPFVARRASVVVLNEAETVSLIPVDAFEGLVHYLVKKFVGCRINSRQSLNAPIWVCLNYSSGYSNILKLTLNF